MKKIFLLVCMFVLISTGAWAATLVQPTPWGSGFKWDLGPKAANGDSFTMIGHPDCVTYTLFLKASGSVVWSSVVKIGGLEASQGTVKTYALTAATTTGYTWSTPTPYMVITHTKTTGAIDSTLVFCNTGGN